MATTLSSVNKQAAPAPRSSWRSPGWWGLFAISAFYASYALVLGAAELLSLMGWVTAEKERAVPVIFVIHALTGGAALMAGALQFNQSILRRHRRAHRVVGRVYVGAIWLSSIGGLWSAIFFEVTITAKFAFGILSVLWFTTTTIALHRARNGQIRQHREWMTRSFALSLFFVSFSFWVPGLAATSLPGDVAYPLAVFLAWALNLAIAEALIRLRPTQA